MPKIAIKKAGNYLNRKKIATTTDLPTKIATNPKTTTILEDRNKGLNFRVKASPLNTKAIKDIKTTMKWPTLRDSMSMRGKTRDSTSMKEEIPLAIASEDTRRIQTNWPPAMSTNTPPPKTYKRK